VIPPIPDDLVLPLNCPWCGRVNDRHHGIDGPAVPKTGDVGLCWGCRKVFVFDAPDRLRRPTADEDAELAKHAGLALARAAARESYIPDEAVAMTRDILGRDDEP
jgi:hypothetical protein